MDIELDGNRIHSERAFHETLALALVSSAVMGTISTPSGIC